MLWDQSFLCCIFSNSSLHNKNKFWKNKAKEDIQIYETGGRSLVVLQVVRKLYRRFYEMEHMFKARPVMAHVWDLMLILHSFIAFIELFL